MIRHLFYTSTYNGNLICQKLTEKLMFLFSRKNAYKKKNLSMENVIIGLSVIIAKKCYTSSDGLKEI